MNESNLREVICCVCGIAFHFSSKIAGLWEDSHKGFYCPNGHRLVWGNEDSDKEELKTLRSEVKELREKVKELTDELEIWRPTSK